MNQCTHTQNWYIAPFFGSYYLVYVQPSSSTRCNKYRVGWLCQSRSKFFCLFWLIADFVWEGVTKAAGVDWKILKQYKNLCWFCCFCWCCCLNKFNLLLLQRYSYICCCCCSPMFFLKTVLTKTFSVVKNKNCCCCCLQCCYCLLCWCWCYWLCCCC